MKPQPSSPPPASRVLLAVLGAVALGVALWHFARDFGYQPNDANVPLTLALAALVTLLVLAWRGLGRDDPGDGEDPERKDDE